MHVCIGDENEGNFCFVYARFLASVETEESKVFSGYANMGNGRNLGCKMQTTNFFYIYGDSGFERK